MRLILAITLILAAIATAADNKKQITERRIVGTWKTGGPGGYSHWEDTRIYSPSKHFYHIFKGFKPDGEVSSSYTSFGVFRIEDDGNITEVTDGSTGEGKLVVDWLDDNSFMGIIRDGPPMLYRRVESK